MMSMTGNDNMIGNWLATSSAVPREELVHMAKLAEQADRYEDMASAMKSLAEKGHELGTEERNLLSVAYSNVVGARRKSWRLISGAEVKLGDNNDQRHRVIKDYRQQVENELQKICGEVQNLIDDHLLKNARSDESIAFYYKMKGDYYRYLAEATIGSERNGIVDSSEQAYKTAIKMAEDTLAPTHPIRLGAALNYSVFVCEIKNDPSGASLLAKTAYDGAIPELQKLQTEDAYKDSTLLMQLLRDNIILWSTEHCGDELDK